MYNNSNEDLFLKNYDHERFIYSEGYFEKNFLNNNNIHLYGKTKVLTSWVRKGSL